MRQATLLMLTLSLAVGLVGCRGQYSEKPPIHPNPNMDNEEKFDPQEANGFFPDNRANRPLVDGVVAREHFRTNPIEATGKMPDGSYVMNNPMPITMALLQRGQERFNIYCSACHDRSGYGKGMAIQYPASQGVPGFPPPTNYHEARVRDMPDGQIFDVITHGVRTMPSYAVQVPVEDRWAIIAYIRALERSQDATVADVPADKLEELKRR